MVKEKKQTKILYLGNQLSQNGFTPTAIEQLGPLLETEGYKIIYASNKKKKIERLVDMAAAIWKNRNIVDVVLIDTYSTTAFYFAWMAAIVCKRLRLPYIPILHGGNLPYRMDTSPKLSADVFGNSFTNIAVSPYLERELKLRSYKAMLIPNSINIADYHFKERQVINPNLLWVRSFHQLYDPQMALLVLKELCARYPGATLTMVGPDKDGTLQQCIELTRSLGIADKVQFTGKLTKNQWTKLSANCDIFINTSTIDNMPFSIVEAMALGMIIVSTDAGGIPELINSSNGIIVKSGDVNAMVKAIENILSSGNAISYSRNARFSAVQYNWDTIKNNWITLLDSIQPKVHA